LTQNKGRCLAALVDVASPVRVARFSVVAAFFDRFLLGFGPFDLAASGQALVT
jgi:hypothetical protein